ncbi:TonB-dependent receptor [Novosphingobium sp. 9]|uniref:TonB-dependent receptor n=1 Tax=Novosphingobium sp. 9 TaxID=2025349 RepID=UPI0028CB8E4D|nr:TonB-dependent receptor plug domain-containing protein [Novosphingobium sp. 9]
MRWNRGIRAGLVGTSAIMVVSAFPGIAFAQQSATGDGTSIAQPATDAETPTGAVVSKDGEPIVVTGSRIKQDPNDSALPLQILTTQTFQRNAITSAEQMLSFLTSNGTGADNLASNSDVTDATRRGNNGASSANLRGQGSGATLILLNGKRVAAHGLTGGAVDVNQIPFAAIERVEVLKDGASAIYGTDAVGGVINFITKKDFTGLDVTGSNNITQYGDAPIYQISATAGYGKLDDQGFNIMGSVSYNYRGALKATQRSFVNTFQHDKGLGVDTRGTPFATIVPLAGTAIASSAATPYVDGTTQLATGGVNILRLPGQAGCDSVPLQGDYDTDVWGAPGNGLACTYDTGRSVYLQQQQKTFTYYTKATKRFGDHELSVEFTGSSAKADKRFSQIQVTPNTTTQNYSYKLVPGVNDAKYNEIYDILSNYYASQGQAVPFTYGQGFSYRWRCMECGEREIKTKTTTFRVAADLTGPMFGDWTYDVSGLYTQSKSGSVLGQGYYYTDKLVSALNSGMSIRSCLRAKPSPPRGWRRCSPLRRRAFRSITASIRCGTAVRPSPVRCSIFRPAR